MQIHVGTYQQYIQASAIHMVVDNIISIIINSIYSHHFALYALGTGSGVQYELLNRSFPATGPRVRVSV